MTTEELKQYMIDSYKSIFGSQYDDERAKASVERILAENKDLESASKAAQALVEKTRNKVEQSRKNFDNLLVIKEQLFDAPSEVKIAFNEVTEYFAFEGLKSTWSSIKLIPLRFKMDKLQIEINKYKEILNNLNDKKKTIQEQINKLLGTKSKGKK